MKKLILLALFVTSSLSFAQTAVDDYRSFWRGNFGRTFEERVKRTNEILDLAVKAADEQGIHYKKISLKNREGKSYPALQIVAQGSSEQNLEAARVARQMFAIPLILSPFDLSSGANAFFDPNGSKIGVPYSFILDGGSKDPSYLHELYHANTYQQVMSGKSPMWAGLTKLNSGAGTYLSSQNNQYYFRFGSVDELVATSLSVKLDVEKILELQRVQTPKDFYQSRGEADELLGSIYHSILIGKVLARQTVDLADRALTKLSSVEHKPMSLSLGKTTKTITESVFTLDSYSWEIVGGRGTHVAVKDGTYFSLYSPKAPTASALQARLLELKNRASRVVSLYQAMEKSIYVLIEFPDLKKTDLNSLGSQASAPFDLLNR